MTEEEKQQQVVRFLAQKRESYFQLILANILQTGKNTNVKECIDAALEGSDYIMQKMYTEPKGDC